MRKIQRIAALGAMAALTVTLAACGGVRVGVQRPDGRPPAAPSSMAAAPSSARGAAASDGVTTNDDVFGPACGQLPQGNAPGGLNAMGPMPVASAASTNPLLTTLVTAVGQVPGPGRHAQPAEGHHRLRPVQRRLRRGEAAGRHRGRSTRC